MKEREQDIRGLNKEYFYFLIEETFDNYGLDSPNHQQIDQAIEKTRGLLRQVLESSFQLVNVKKIAESCNLSAMRVKELYSEAVNQVFNLLQSETNQH